jgi:hypothetical protein
MTRYWNLTIRQRTELTEEQLQKLLQVELMENGIVPAIEPALQDVPVAEPPNTIGWRIGNVVFLEHASVEKFLQLAPCQADYEHRAGYENKVLKPYSQQVDMVQLYDEPAMQRNLAALQEAHAAKTHNEKAMKEYRAACDANHNATRALMDDYADCKRQLAEAEQVVRTFDEYVELADGNYHSAARFLAAAYKGRDVVAAFELAGRVWQWDAPDANHELPPAPLPTAAPLLPTEEYDPFDGG